MLEQRSKVVYVLYPWARAQWLELCAIQSTLQSLDFSRQLIVEKHFLIFGEYKQILQIDKKYAIFDINSKNILYYTHINLYNV